MRFGIYDTDGGNPGKHFWIVDCGNSTCYSKWWIWAVVKAIYRNARVNYLMRAERRKLARLKKWTDMWKQVCNDS